MTLEEIITDIHAISEDLEEYEKRYNLLSETFYEWYQRGEEPEDASWVLDFSMWAGLYEIKLERQKMYRELVQDNMRPEIAALELTMREITLPEPA